jgi:flagellar M-ring protein FliF
MAALDLAGILPASLWDRIAPVLQGNTRILVLAGAAIAAALAGAALLWSWSGSYSVLYAGLSGEEGGRAIGELQKLNIPYRIAEGGRVILVPAGELGRARLQLAVRGVPKQEGDQWALLDNEGLGVSPFLEQVHYLRAVEAALARTVQQIDGVVYAKVSLALPKQTDFLADAPKPSASVMVRLRPGFELSPSQVEGVAGLVAGSVPGLVRDNVTIVDQSGRVLGQGLRGGLQQVPQQFGITRDIERRYVAAITDLLAPVLGRGNFRVAVDADVDFSRAKESSIKYGAGHVLSQDESIHPNVPGAAALGIPGALSNRPPPAPTTATQPAQPAAAATSPAAAAPAAPEKPTPPLPPDTHKTTNYDLDRTVQFLERPAWTLRGLDVAVLVNNASGRPIPAARIKSINTLVDSAIGVGQNRHVAVVDLPFAEASAAAPGVGAPWWQDAWMGAAAQNALLALAGLMVLFGGVFPVLRRIDAGQVAVARLAASAPLAAGRAAPKLAPPVRTAPQLRAELSGKAGGAQDVFSIDVETVRTLVTNDPARTAQVIKEWIARDRSQLTAAD